MNKKYIYLDAFSKFLEEQDNRASHSSISLISHSKSNCFKIAARESSLLFQFIFLTFKVLEHQGGTSFLWTGFCKFYLPNTLVAISSKTNSNNSLKSLLLSNLVKRTISILQERLNPHLKL